MKVTVSNKSFSFVYYIYMRFYHIIYICIYLCLTASYQYQSRRRTKNNLEQDNHCGASSHFSEIIDHYSKNHDADQTQSRILLSPSYRNSGKAAVLDDDCMRTQQNDDNKNNSNDFSIDKNNRNNNKVIVDEVIELPSDEDDDHNDDEDKATIKQRSSSSSSFRNNSTAVHYDDSITRHHKNNKNKNKNKNKNNNSSNDSLDNRNNRIEKITNEIIVILSNGETSIDNNDEDDDDIMAVWDENDISSTVTTTSTIINTPSISLSNKTANINENINDDVHHKAPHIHDESSSGVGTKTVIESSIVPLLGESPFVEEPPPINLLTGDGLGTGLIVGIAIGFILGVALIGGMSYNQASKPINPEPIIAPLVVLKQTMPTPGCSQSKMSSSSKASVKGLSAAVSKEVVGSKTPKKSLMSSLSSITTSDSNVVINIIAPAGKLGIEVEYPRDTFFPFIKTVLDHSTLKDQLYPNDLIISIDNRSTSSMTLDMIVYKLRDDYPRKQRIIVIERLMMNKDYRTVIAPSGNLGIMIDKKPNGQPIVKHVYKKSPLYNTVLVNDKIIAIDDQRYVMRTIDSISKYLRLQIRKERIFQVCTPTPVNRTRSVVTPVGRLGIIIDKHGIIIRINETSPLIDQLIVGDIILRIDNLDVETMTNESLIEYIKKNEDKELTLIVIHPTTMEYAMKVPLGKLGMGVIDSKTDVSGQNPIVQHINSGSPLLNQLKVNDQVKCVDNQTTNYTKSSSMIADYFKDNQDNNGSNIIFHRSNIDELTSVSAFTIATATPGAGIDNEAAALVPSGAAITTTTDETENSTTNADAIDAALSATATTTVATSASNATTTTSYSAKKEINSTRSFTSFAACNGLTTAAFVGAAVYTTKNDDDDDYEREEGEEEEDYDTSLELNTQESSTTTEVEELEIELDAMMTDSPNIAAIAAPVAVGAAVVCTAAVVTASSLSLNNEDELDLQRLVKKHHLSQYCHNKNKERIVASFEDYDNDGINRMVEDSDQNAHASKRQKNDHNSKKECVARNLRPRSVLSLKNSKCINNVTKEGHDDAHRHNDKNLKTKAAKDQEAIEKVRLLQEELTSKKQFVHFDQLYDNGMQYLKQYKYYSASIELSNSGNIMKQLILNFIQQKRYINKNENGVNSCENIAYSRLRVMVEKYAKCYYYKAMCNYKDNKYLQAITELNKIIVVDDNINTQATTSSNQIDCQTNNVLLPNDILDMIPKSIQADALCQRAKANLHMKLSIWKKNDYDDDNVDDIDDADTNSIDSFDNNIISSDMIYQQLLRHPNESANIMKDVKAAASLKNKDAILWYNILQSQQRNKLNLMR